MEDFDSLLDAVENSFLHREVIKPQNAPPKDTPDNVPQEISKCTTPYVGCKETSQRQRLCSALRCIHCDFTVICIPENEWLPGTNYLFLRTNMPNRQKLDKQLNPCSEASAYACQCNYYTARRTLPIHIIPALNWVCRGHPQ